MEEVSTCPADERVTAISMTSEFIALGVPTGYKIFSLNPIKLIKYKDMGGEIGQIGLYRTDKIIWFVGSGDMPAAPINEFRLWDNDNDEQLWKIMLKSTIKTVIVKHNNVLISLIDSAWIYTLPFSEKDNVILNFSWSNYKYKNKYNFILHNFSKHILGFKLKKTYPFS